MAVKPVSVSQLNSYISRVMSCDPILMNVSVQGEIANLTKHSSGHWYFSLKDNSSKINCFLASSRVEHLRFELDEGMEITAFGNVSVYEKGGYYSLNIRDVEIQGEGALQIAFEKLKKKLEEEGLFNEEHKRPLPEFPGKIGVITSPTGAAIRDIVTTVKRRNPLVDILLYPALVQGEGSAASISEAIENMNRSFPELDLLIVGRGGGSAEDLWSFNEETVARAVFNSDIPVISAVGHEVDTVITDYVADVRAATPTAAAELAVPHINNYLDRIYSCNPQRMYSSLTDRVDNGFIRLNHLCDICRSSLDLKMTEAEGSLRIIKSELESYNPLSVLSKGFAAVKDANGNWLTNAEKVNNGDRIQIILQDAKLNCLVESKEKYDAKNKKADI